VLNLSEGSAYNRIETARAARRYPKVLEGLERGDLTLTAARLLAPHLTPANHDEVLAIARHRSKQGIQELIASLNPRPPTATIIRRVAPQPATTDGEPESAPAQQREAVVATSTAADSSTSSGEQDVAAAPVPQFCRAVVTPLAPERYKLQVTLARETHEKLRRAQALARHTLPDGDVGAILDRALTLLIDDLERRRFALVASPRSNPDVSTASGRPHTVGCQACGVAARRGPLRIRWTDGSLRRDGVPRVPSCRAVRGGRRGDDGQHPAPLPRTQPV
jgi:hypothetical protein